MEKQKIYVFFTHDMNTVAGSQMYTAGKTLYLAKLGWKVFYCHSGSPKRPVIISNIAEYVKNSAGLPMLWTPPYRLNKSDQEKVLNYIVQKLGCSDFGNCEIIVESHDDFFAYWAELFAEKVGGRHFFFALHEVYRHIPDKIELPNRYFEDNLDFFYFKWKRNELVSRQSAGAWQKLFNGYKNVTAPLTAMPCSILEMDPVQDVDFPKINEIQKLDWNICHVGRIGKDYVPYVIEGVAELAKKYPDKKINFIFVGNVAARIDLLNKSFKNLGNVHLTFIGNICPIPRILFSKVDVVCAIAQSALFTANAGVLTIVGSAENPEKNRGLLGYDTMERTFGKGTFSYLEMLENVLVKRLYDNKKYSLPKLESPDSTYETFWTILKNADPKKEYYTERLSLDRVRPWFAPFPFAAIARGTKIILAGATEIASDYVKQVHYQNYCTVEISPDGIKNLDDKPYCQILATIDEHPENFDDSVTGFDRLKQLDYDAIIITVYSWKVEETRKKILDIVPQMEDRIIDNIKFINVYRMEHKELKLFED